MPAVRIQTGARLHFGPLSYLPAQGPHFGGIGLMVEQPGVRLLACPSSGDSEVVGSERAAELLSRIEIRRRKLLEPPDSSPAIPVRIAVEDEISPHAGLGSGTQLALALAEAVTCCAGESLPLTELARLGQRGERSAIGLYGYLQGGFLVDAGHQQGADLGELACRVAFPEDWSLLLVTPPGAGLHGTPERSAFAQLQPMPETTTDRLCGLVLRELLPALQSRDYSRFVSGISEYGRQIGEFFSPLQGGEFVVPGMAGLVEESLQGAGAVQSSWGPTVVAFAEHPETAAQLETGIRAHSLGQHCRITSTRARNQGRTLTIG